MNPAAKVIFLNGVGSVGKTSIAKELQTILAEPYLHVGIDHFIDMLPAHYINSAEGIRFETIESNGHPIVKISVGEIGTHLINGMHQAIAAMASQGNNLIIDEVLVGNEMEKYTTLLAPFKVFYIGVFAPLDVIEERERKRGDRLVGLARWQFDIVHKDKHYDFIIDTTSQTPLECAQLIKNRFNL